MTEKSDSPKPQVWTQPEPRAEMVATIRALNPKERMARLGIDYRAAGHIDDEVVVTLALEAWRAGKTSESNSYSSVLLRRVTKQVRAHVGKNPEWARLGGGKKAAAEDFSQEVVVSIFKDATVPCHAEVAFGDYVYRRCLDQAGKLYAKKRSAGESLDDEHVEAEAQMSSSDDSPATSKSAEEALIDLWDLWEEEQQLEKILEIVLSEAMPELAARAFTYRFYAGMKIESKVEGAITVTSLMRVTEKTATKYINEAITIIKQRLTNDD